MFTKNKISENKLFKFSITSVGVLVLLLFSILVLLKNKNFERENCFSLAMPEEHFFENICKCSLEKILSFYNFKTHILLKEEFNEKQKQFKLIQNDIQKIISTKDSENGIHIKLSKTTSYEDVVKVLDICQIESAPTYILIDYDIWIVAGTSSKYKKHCKF